MKGKNIFWKKIVSVVTIFSFLTTIMQGYGISAAPPAMNIQTTPLTQLYDHGKIIDQHNGTSTEKIYCIQDLHCNPSAQKNISGIIKTLTKTYGNNNIIGIEGSSSIIDTGILRIIPNGTIKKAVINDLLKQGYLTGAEIYQAQNTNHDIRLFGLENREIYRKNFNALHQSLTYRDTIENITQQMDKIIEKAKKIVFNKKLKKFDKIIQNHKKNAISFDDFLSYLIETGSQNKIDMHLYPTINRYTHAKKMLKNISETEVQRDARSITRQLGKKIHALLKNNNQSYYDKLAYILESNNVKYEKQYPRLAYYLKYLKESKNTQNKNLFLEKNALQFTIAMKLAENNTDSKDCIYLERYLALLKGYCTNSSTLEEVQAFEQGKKRFFAIASGLKPRIYPQNPVNVRIKCSSNSGEKCRSVRKEI